MLKIQPEVEGDRAVLRLVGEVDLATAPALLDAIAATDVPDVVVDLADVTLLDSSGIRALLRGRALAAERGVTVTVEGARGIVEAALRVANVADLFGLR